MENREDITKDKKMNENEQNEEEVLKQDNDDTLNEDEQNQEKEELKKKTKELEELTDSYMRLQADFMNYKKRMEKDKVSTIAYANEDLISELLPILDNFERALSSVEEEDNSFYEGMKMIYDQMIKVLTKSGLEEIEALGEKFDPNYHHAAFMEESESDEEGTILEVFQKGYKLKDKVIRPSMVKVAK